MLLFFFTYREILASGIAKKRGHPVTYEIVVRNHFAIVIFFPGWKIHLAFRKNFLKKKSENVQKQGLFLR